MSDHIHTIREASADIAARAQRINLDTHTPDPDGRVKLAASLPDDLRQMRRQMEQLHMAMVLGQATDTLRKHGIIVVVGFGDAGEGTNDAAKIAQFCADLKAVTVAIETNKGRVGITNTTSAAAPTGQSEKPSAPKPARFHIELHKITVRVPEVADVFKSTTAATTFLADATALFDSILDSYIESNGGRMPRAATPHVLSLLAMDFALARLGNLYPATIKVNVTDLRDGVSETLDRLFC